MKISILKPDSVNVNPWIPEFKKRGIKVLENRTDKNCDFIICASHSQINVLEYYHRMYPSIPIINYNWDLYEWIWANPRGYDWQKYGHFLKKSREIWVPSEEVSMRSQEYFGVGHKCKTIQTFARFFEADEKDIFDKRYIYNPLRSIPDRNYGWLKKVCETNDIPLFSSNHRLSEEEFKKSILECSFMVCEYYEASTGGLTLLEGYYHGKPCIISDSPYMGAKEYLGDNAIYFKHDSYENFEKVILNTWNNTPLLDTAETKQIFNHLTVEAMVEKMIERMEAIK